MEPDPSTRLARTLPCHWTPPARDVPMGGRGGGAVIPWLAAQPEGVPAASMGARGHRSPGDMRPEPLRLSARGWDCH